jgi:ABC-type transport system involved in multi-copper enzyme maturation permease subunit
MIWKESDETLKNRLRGKIKDYLRLTHLSIQLIAGRRFYITVLLPLLWPAFQVFLLLVGWRQSEIEAVEVQSLIGLPLVIYAIGLGIRIIASEVDRRTLEIAYTVPGGSHRIWLAKMTACFCLLLFSEVLLAIVTLILFTSFPFVSFYGAFQAAVFYMVVGMAFAALFRSEISGAMATALFLTVNFLIDSGGVNMVSDINHRISPFFNPLAFDSNMTDVSAYTIQNRILFIIVILAITLLTFSRVERREKMLGD